MAQYKEWEGEYKDPSFVSLDGKPQKDTLRFFKFLKKSDFDLSKISVLDIGSGVGKNSNYLSLLGANVTGIEISKTAVEIAKIRANELGLKTNFIEGDISKRLPLNDNSIDVVLDIMSSNSLTEAERQNYINEVNRVMKPGGVMYIKALCLEGDKNAKKLIKQLPASEKDSYILGETGITEKAFNREDFMNTYCRDFDILELKKKTNYTRFNNQRYKRNFWIAYLQK